jgi:YVTN family beta-propeller protein
MRKIKHILFQYFIQNSFRGTMRTVLVFSLSLLVLFVTGYSQTHSGLHLAKKNVISGEGGWDYLSVDSKARRLYLSHSDKVVVVDADSLSVIGEIPNTKGVHGIAIAGEFNHGFISNGIPSTVSMFDLKTMKVLKEFPVGKKPDAILFDPASKRIFAFNGQSEDASVIDADSGTVIATIPLGGGPEFGVSDGQGRVYVNIENKSEIVAIDSRSLKVLSHWSIAPGEEPSGLAMDVQHHRLFSVCRNKMMMIIDSDSGKVIASLPIGTGVDGCAFDPGTQNAFSSNGEGTFTVVHENSPGSFAVTENATTQRGARTIAVDPTTHFVYTVTAEFGPAPAPTAERPRPRPAILPNTFVVLKYQQ